MKTPWPWLALLVVLVGGGALTWSLWPTPEPEIADEDTGMSEDAENQLLQEIGYLKGGSR